MKLFQPSEIVTSLPTQFFASLVAKVNKVVAAGHDVINLGQGNPDQPTPQHIVKALQNAAEKTIHHKYPPFRGHESLKEAVATFYQREYDVVVNPKTEVAILFGGKAGLVELPICFTNPGDTILVPDPGYPDYLSGVALAKAQFETMPLIAENKFLPDYTKIDASIAERAKLMFLNYPNNPTGATASKDFFDATIQFANKHNILVVHDFAYGAIGFDGQKPVSFLQADGAKDTGIEIYTLSKTFNMAGWRIAFAVGNESVIETINLLQDHMYVSIFGAVQDAAREALLSSQSCVIDLVNSYESRRNALISACHSIGWNVDIPTGSFFAWLPVPKGYTSEQFSDILLEKAHVAVAPGVGFGEHGEGYVRVGLLHTEDRLREAINRIDKLNFFKK
ncbi:MULTISPECIES: pyridoxal phosphate-dependent aminotransferase [Bacillus cereus group]|uniref:pyridoxal phosphate-dependent aminotransferase n=1 Tax=Bacillus cereus group TaxID=86661 RepID=UPI0008FD76C4|nr:MULTISPECIES: pyridoxal phosphate-dependent aminotransferase [Bacillus cereus group]MDA1564090.1 pyridoxal phosphate-dependent aminotransferase [Bacillus cereus group sp. TH243-1LC]MDA1638097.1 pyridoxal phosphate-dependent aminotransferase [Bacillus cereus group sp. TH177-1LC]MDA1657157.1 pyridoxal phosphate-dependent aminotransferase [Bacillus cereus group sp. TH150LC]MDA1857605.1 pyridoxal phosphate-dependent aminotransferase [Bacillus cereus group sp. BY122LC]TNP22580.1 pyridoxal phosph